jgi:hypothetical protein
VFQWEVVRCTASQSGVPRGPPVRVSRRAAVDNNRCSNKRQLPTAWQETGRLALARLARCGSLCGVCILPGLRCQHAGVTVVLATARVDTNSVLQYTT